MDLDTFGVLWPELMIQKRNQLAPEIYLRDILVRILGETERSGRQGIAFEHVNENLSPYILRPERLSFDSPLYCYWWNEEKEQWESLGELFFKMEWGIHQFARFWKIGGLQFSKGKRIALESVIDRYLGEKEGGLLFIGKGAWEGESLILKLEEDEKLSDYWQPQKCYRLNRNSGEWEFFGLFLKRYHSGPQT